MSFDHVDRNEFRTYVDTLKINRNFPGIQGIGFLVVVPSHDKDRHIADIRTQGFPNYSIRPEGERDIYSSILYLEPFADRNLRAFVYDMYSEPVRRKAMADSRVGRKTQPKTWLESKEALDEAMGFLQPYIVGTQAEIDRLFQFFSRLQLRSRYEGTGMGLALCRRIVEHHGGNIRAESQGECCGSTFSFELPLSKPPQQHAEEPLYE